MSADTVDLLFATPEEFKEWLAESFPDNPHLISVLEGVYAAGVVHSQQGLIAYVDSGEDPNSNVGDNSNVH